MRKGKIYIGLASLLLTAAAAFANAKRHRDIIVYFSENGFPVATTINFNCSAAGRGCVNQIRGVTEQLYADPGLEYPLQQDL